MIVLAGGKRPPYLVHALPLAIGGQTDMRAILESKRALRERLVSLPISEKLRLLEQLRDRALAITASRAARSVRDRGVEQA